MLRALRIEASLAKDWLLSIPVFGLVACLAFPLLPKGGVSMPFLMALLVLTMAWATGELEVAGEGWNARQLAMPVSRGSYVRARFVLWGLAVPFASLVGTLLMCVADALWCGGALLPMHALLGIVSLGVVYGWVLLGIPLALQMRGVRRAALLIPFVVGVSLFMVMNWSGELGSVLATADASATLGFSVMGLLAGLGVLVACGIVAELGFVRRDL